MAINFEDIIAKVKDGADVAVEVTGDALKNTKKALDRSIDISALNAKIRRINLSIKNECKEIGELVYSTHKDPETSAEDLQDKLERIDGLYEELDAVIAERDRRKAE